MNLTLKFQLILNFKMSKHSPLTYSNKPFKDVDHFINNEGLHLRKKVWKVKSPK